MKFFKILCVVCFFQSCNSSIANSDMNCIDLYNNAQLSTFSLKDLNIHSTTYNENIYPELYSGKIRLFYFSSDET